MLRKHFPKAPRVRIDCEHYRAIQEDKLSAEVRAAAEANSLADLLTSAPVEPTEERAAETDETPQVDNHGLTVIQFRFVERRVNY